jgi:hypothetical protein
MSRALSVNQIYNTKRNLLEFTGQWLDAIGRPEVRGSWIIWAGSGHGKTTFIMQLCKYLTSFGRVLYNTLEEGNSESLKLVLKDVKMEEVSDKITFLDQEPMDELSERLRRHKAPRIVVIDSWQYADMTLKQYKAMIKEFNNTLFIIISHAEGKEPEGKVAKKIRYDAMVKIHVEGYKAFCKSRYLRGIGPPIIIWQEGAELYHGKI